MMKRCRLSSCIKVALITGVLCCQANIRVVAQEAVLDQAEAAEGPADTEKPAAISQLREIIVSYAQVNSKLQLYRLKDNGSSRRRITD